LGSKQKTGMDANKIDAGSDMKKILYPRIGLFQVVCKTIVSFLKKIKSITDNHSQQHQIIQSC